MVNEKGKADAANLLDKGWRRGFYSLSVILKIDVNFVLIVE